MFEDFQAAEIGDPTVQDGLLDEFAGTSEYDEGLSDVCVSASGFQGRTPPMLALEPDDDDADRPMVSKRRRTPGGTGLSLNFGQSAARRRRKLFS